MSRVMLAVVGVLLVFLLLHATPASSPSAPLHIYMSATESRSNSASAIVAARLAVSLSPAVTGSHPVELIVMENSDVHGTVSASLEKQNALRAAEDPQAVAYIGPQDSDLALIDAPLLNAAGIPMLGFADALQVSGAINIAPTNDSLVSGLTVWLHDLGIARAYMVTDGSAQGTLLSNTLQSALPPLGVVVSGGGLASGPIGAVNAVSYAQKMHADMLIYTGSSVAVASRLVVQLRGTGIAFMGTNSVIDDALTNVTDSNETVYALGIGAPAVSVGTQSAREFAQAYVHTQDDEPFPDAPVAYDAVGAVIAAIRASHSESRPLIASALLATKNYAGALGTWSVDTSGNNTTQLLSEYTIQGGKWVFMKTLPVR